MKTGNEVIFRKYFPLAFKVMTDTLKVLTNEYSAPSAGEHGNYTFAEQHLSYLTLWELQSSDLRTCSSRMNCGNL